MKVLIGRLISKLRTIISRFPTKNVPVCLWRNWSDDNFWYNVKVQLRPNYWWPFTDPTESDASETGAHHFADDGREWMGGGVVSVEVGRVPVRQSRHYYPVDVLQHFLPRLALFRRLFRQQVFQIARLDWRQDWSETKKNSRIIQQKYIYFFNVGFLECRFKLNK